MTSSEATSQKHSLYERLGGVYNIAVVVDDLIDRVMTDARLNANPLVDEAHHKVPPAGFKYLVTEMLCWAAGGPQRYSGRTMEDSHRNLGIPASGRRSWTTCSRLSINSPSQLRSRLRSGRLSRVRARELSLPMRSRSSPLRSSPARSDRPLTPKDRSGQEPDHRGDADCLERLSYDRVLELFRDRRRAATS
jgi:truncated hemoglobin YjbI